MNLRQMNAAFGSREVLEKAGTFKFREGTVSFEIKGGNLLSLSYSNPKVTHPLITGGIVRDKEAPISLWIPATLDELYHHLWPQKAIAV